MQPLEFTNNENDKKQKPLTLTQLAQMYNVSLPTMYKWLKRAGVLKNKRNGYLFTPKEVKEIFDKLGEP